LLPGAAINDPDMRDSQPLAGPADRIPAWNHARDRLFRMVQTGAVPKFALLASFAWLMRSTWGEISYWHELTRNQVALLQGSTLRWYWMMASCKPFPVSSR
jgi:hypothetical protein